MSLAARPISGTRGRPPCSASAQAIASKRGELLAAAAAHRRESQHSVKCSWEAPDSADLHFTREFVAFLFASLLPLPFYLTFLRTLRLDVLSTRWDRNQVNNKSSSPLYRGKGAGEAFTERFLLADALALTFIDSPQ